WKLYQEALYSDYKDIQGGTTAEGIHSGVMAATIYITLSTFAGVDIRNEELHIKPKLPNNWSRISFSLKFNGVIYGFIISQNQIEVTVEKDSVIIVNGKKINLSSNHKNIIEYQYAIK
ncbi:MAG: trePP, partial [Clostridiales bacterium]|nr:trePP [Clostridiales bacterium]